ncbi:MAG: hypothetical protein ACI9MU_004102, partial [Alphaproteobacteria bacterium]
MTDLLAALPPKPLPVENRPPPGSGLGNTPGLEDDNVDTGQFWSTDEGPTFAEFLDIINPLQHIPVVSTLYRAITGDQIGTGPRVAGGMLFGGPVGALVAGITALFEEASGGDIGEHIADLIDDFTGSGDDGGETPSVAAAKADPSKDTPKDTLAGAQAGLDAGTQTGAAVQQAAALAGTPIASTAIAPVAAQLNRIAVNPAAAMGAVQGSVQNGTPTASASATSIPFPARPLAMPFGAPTSADPSANARSRNQPFLRPAIFNAPAADPTGQAHGSAQPAGAPTIIPAPQVSDAVTRSRRQQTDLMLAQWAAQQMAQQNGTPAAPAQKNDNGRPDPQTAAANATEAKHPMLPPRNASPEWYAQAMDQA